MTQEKPRDAVLSCRDEARKAKANLKLNLEKKRQKKDSTSFKLPILLKELKRLGGKDHDNNITEGLIAPLLFFLFF